MFKSAYEEQLKGKGQFQRIESSSAIQALVLPGNERVKRISEQLQQQGFDVRPIRSPTVKQGEERLRICLHSFNTDQEILALISALDTCKEE